MARYFRSLRSLSGNALDKQGIVKAFEKGINGDELPFRTVANSFHLIGQDTRTIYIPHQEGAAWVDQLREGTSSKALYRKLGRYAVSVYEHHFQALRNVGALLTSKEVPTLDDDSAILTDMALYSDTMGLSLEGESNHA